MTHFPSTHWSFVEQLRQADTDSKRQLIEVFLHRYLPPMRAFLRGNFRYVSEEDAEDFLQDFVTDHLLHKNLLDMVDRDRGTLRTFVCKCLKNSILMNLRRNARHTAARQHTSDTPLTDTSIDEITDGFDRAWAQHVLTESIIRLKDECHQSERQTLWDVFDMRVLRPMTLGTEPVPYKELAARCQTTPRRLENLLITAKRKFQSHLKHVVGDYTGSAQDINDEINDLMNIFAQAPPHRENEDTRSA